jgi:arylsulfatase A-like enzyme
MIRTAHWKYFFYTNGEEFLYDMAKDPLEETNLAAKPEYSALAAELKQRASTGWVQSKRPLREIAGQATEAGDRPARKKLKKP